MKSFNRSNKYKTDGVSLLLAIVCSTIAMSIVIAVLSTIGRSVEQSQNLERSTQVFFAIESGLEAGFFHHNARGQGVRFLDIDHDEFDPNQIIVHSATTLETKWTLDGLAKSDSIEGLIYEDAPLQLRWFWDGSKSVSALPEENKRQPEPAFVLSFPDPDGIIPAGFDFGLGVDQNGVILSWMLTRKNDRLQSLVSSAPDPEYPCIDSLFICRENFEMASLDSGDTKTDNTLLPREGLDTTKKLSSFSGGGGDFQLILTPMRPFLDSTGQRIRGIPFTLDDEENLPLPEYTLHTSVSTNDFSKELTLLNIPEQTAIQAFSYAIFE